MEESQIKKILKDYSEDLSDKHSKLLERQMDWASSVEEHSVTFSQFLASICAGLLAIFFSVKDFNRLIINHSRFNWAVGIYLISFLLFILYSKEKIDHDSVRLVENTKKGEIDYKDAHDILDRQFKNVFDTNIFYKEIQDLFEKKSLEASKKPKEEYSNYFLEFFTFCFITSLWLVFCSTQNFNIVILYLGIIIIFYFTNNQNQLFYKLIFLYSKIMSKIFPTKSV